jgi:pyruvate,water dikinase
LRALGRTARQQGQSSQRSAHQPDALRQQAEAKAERALRRKPIRRFLFRRVLNAARQRVQTRENLRFERTRVFGRVRRILVELGRRLYGEQILDSPSDVFYLELHELLGFVEGHATTTNLRDLAATRQREFAQHRKASTPADRFHTYGAVHVGHSFAGAQPIEADDTPATWRGTGCASGVVRGKARIIHDPTTVELNGDEILVAEHTDPGWVILFPAARGVLVERGSLLSHSAIVAREMGVPTIVGLPGITRAVEDGQWLEMDGAAGTVRRVDDES